MATSVGSTNLTTSNTWQLLEAINPDPSQSSTMGVYVNGSAVQAVTTSNVTQSGTTAITAPLFINGQGGTSTNSVPVYLAELVVFNTGLSASNRQLIEGYLAWKWGLQGNLPINHPYYSATPSAGVASAGNMNVDYLGNIQVAPTNNFRILAPTEWRTNMVTVSGTSFTIPTPTNLLPSTYSAALYTLTNTGFNALTLPTYTSADPGIFWELYNSTNTNLTISVTYTSGSGLGSSFTLNAGCSTNIYWNGTVFQAISGQGPTGPTGPRGFQGLIGNQGVQGFQGPQGVQGLIGYQGPQGVQGFQGPQGVQGLIGNQGPQGVQGFQGPQGWQGMIGYQGPQGNQGNQGPLGVGIQGVQGPAGGGGGSSVSITGATGFGSVLTVATGGTGLYGNSNMTFDGSTLNVTGTEVIKFNGTSDITNYGPAYDTLTLQSTNTSSAAGIASLMFANASLSYPMSRIYSVDTGSSANIVFQSMIGISGTVMSTFAYTGATQTYTVGAGITALNVYLWGAAGGGETSPAGTGGAGAMIQGVLAVTPGQTLTILVGGGGQSSGAGGFGGGGVAANQYAGGGGRSSISVSGTEVVIAGAGGGGVQTVGGGIGTFSGNGGNGSGWDGTTSMGGQGGNANGTGGAGGTGSYANGAAGSGRLGGNGTIYSSGGGAGYGGGGSSGVSGSAGASGGGGSSLTSNLTLIPGQSVLGYNSTNGYSAPNSSSPYYVSGVAAGVSAGNGGNGLVVIVPSTTGTSMTEVMRTDTYGNLSLAKSLQISNAGTVGPDASSNFTVAPTNKVRLQGPTEWRYITSNVSGTGVTVDLTASSNYYATTFRLTGASATINLADPSTSPSGIWWKFSNASNAAQTLTFTGTYTGLTTPYTLGSNVGITLYSDGSSYYIRNSAGPTGPQGWQGPVGQSAVGVQGNQGWQGTNGAQGWQGAAGTNGTNGTNGAQGWQGPVGQSAVGVQGNQGWQGVIGPTGPSAAGGSSLSILGATGFWNVLTVATGGTGIYGNTNLYFSNNSNLGIQTTTPATALDVNGGVTIRNGLRPLYSNVSSGTSLTVAPNSFGTMFDITVSSLTGITLPTVVWSNDSNAYWTFRNNTSGYLSITFTYTGSYTTAPTNPVAIPPANAVTLMLTYPSGSTSNYVLF